MKIQTLSSFLFTTLVLSCGALIIPAQAENTGSLRFLENYAVRLHARGETVLAQKEFDRILRLDPQNTIALNYLKNNPAEPNTPLPTSSLSGLMQDIAGLRTDILSFEKDADELEHTIRLMMGENDNLYTALRKRSRDLAELRAQMKGTPYDKEYAELMKALPPDRVPQHLLNTRDVLPSGSRRELITQDEVEALAREIADREQEINVLNAKAANPEQMQELTKTLNEKRALLVEKNLALIEKTASLSQLKDNVAGMNVVLKDADHRYGTTLTELEALTRKIHTEIANKENPDQQRYRELLADYAARIREVEILKQDIQTRSASLSEQKPALEKQEAVITRLDTAVKDNTQDLAKYEQLLKEYKEALAAKDAVIAKKEESLAQKNAAIAEQSVLITQKEALIEQKSATIAEKAALITEKEKAIAQKEDVIVEKTTTITKQTALIEDKNAAIAEQNAVIAVQDQDITNKAILITQKDAVITEKDSVIVKQTTDLSMTNDQLNAVGEKIGSIEQLLADNDNDILALKNGIDQMKEITRTRSTQEVANAKELASKVRRLETTLTKLEEIPLQASSDEQDLSASLRRSEDALLTAEKSLAKKTSEVSALAEELTITQKTIEQLKSKLSSLEDARTPTPQKPVEAVKEVPVVPSDSPALHQILATRDDEIVVLNTRLLQKDEDIRQLSAMMKAYKESALKADALAREQSARSAEKIAQSEKNATDSRCSLQGYELDIKEKESTIAALQNDLNDRTAALKSASTQAAFLEEKLTALSLKQEAIRTVITKRDATIGTLEQEINTLKKQLKQEKK